MLVIQARDSKKLSRFLQKQYHDIHIPIYYLLWIINYWREAAEYYNNAIAMSLVWSTGTLAKSFNEKFGTHCNELQLLPLQSNANS